VGDWISGDVTGRSLTETYAKAFEALMPLVFDPPFTQGRVSHDQNHAFIHRLDVSFIGVVIARSKRGG
jgi:hypothetical protein